MNLLLIMKLHSVEYSKPQFRQPRMVNLSVFKAFLTLAATAAHKRSGINHALYPVLHSCIHEHIFNALGAVCS